MKRFFQHLAAAFLVAGLFASSVPARAADLTPDQVAAIRAQLEAMQDQLEGKASERNRSAWSVFMEAAVDARKAAELFERCTKVVDFDREGRSDSEFRDWQGNQKDRYRNDQYMEGLQLQLRWLAITCKAAEAEKLSTVIPDVIGYVESLTSLSEMPGNAALTSVGGTIFVRAYELERVIGNNESWEPIPFNIAGIYEKTILPYLRVENTDQLMSAWDRRIAQQTRLVAFLTSKQEEAVRGDRDDKRRIQDQQRRQQENRNVLKDHDEDDFERDTLPQLKWSRLRDKYDYVDKVAAAQEMLAFMNEHLTNKKAPDWLTEFLLLISDAQSPGRIIEADPPVSTPGPTTSTTTTPTTPGAGTGPVTAESLGLD